MNTLHEPMSLDIALAVLIGTMQQNRRSQKYQHAMARVYAELQALCKLNVGVFRGLRQHDPIALDLLAFEVLEAQLKTSSTFEPQGESAARGWLRLALERRAATHLKRSRRKNVVSLDAEDFRLRSTDVELVEASHDATADDVHDPYITRQESFCRVLDAFVSTLETVRKDRRARDEAMAVLHRDLIYGRLSIERWYDQQMGTGLSAKDKSRKRNALQKQVSRFRRGLLEFIDLVNADISDADREITRAALDRMRRVAP